MLFEKLRSTARMAALLPALVRHRRDGTYTVADRLEERARAHGDRPFLVYEDREVSYAALDAGANRVAHWAAARGLRRGDAVALLMENRPEYVQTWAGLAKLGVVTALVNTHVSGRALDHALRAAGARHLVVGGECLPALAGASPEVLGALEIWTWPDPPGPSAPSDPAEASLPRLPEARELSSLLSEAPADVPDPRLREGLRTGHELFYIYTSGTTGPPKAARFSHQRFLASSDVFARAAGTRPDDVEYLALPLYHTAGGVVALGRALAAGATVALARRFRASRFWDDVRRHRATSFQYIGELCRYLLAQPPREDDADNPIRVAVGNGLRPDVWRPFQERFAIERIVEFYGATEANTALINLEGRVGAVGRVPFRALSNARIVRFDVETESHPRDARGFCIECAPGEPGELLGEVPRGRLAPQGHFEGYTSPEASERKILRDVFREGDAWFRSGDLLYRDEDGYYYFVDRIGDTFRWKGENVSTQEVAEILSGFPGLGMVLVYGVVVPGHEGRAGMLAFAPASEGREDADLDGRALYGFVEEHLPRYAAPVFVRALPRAPVTGTFKLRKVDLQREGWDPESVRDPLWVRDDAAKAYVPLTARVAEEIRAGARRP